MGARFRCDLSGSDSGDMLESLGDVEHIDRPVSAVLEAAAITRRSTEQGRPAPLFDNVEGAQPGFRLLGAPGALSSDRRAIA